MFKKHTGKVFIMSKGNDKKSDSSVLCKKTMSIWDETENYSLEQRCSL